jgi:hypothetical protein
MRQLASHGRLILMQWVSLQGTLIRGFNVVNSRGRTLALGALPGIDSPGFCIMHARRYDRDRVLVAAVERLIGFPVRPYPTPLPKRLAGLQHRRAT